MTWADAIVGTLAVLFGTAVVVGGIMSGAFLILSGISIIVAVLRGL